MQLRRSNAHRKHTLCSVLQQRLRAGVQGCSGGDHIVHKQDTFSFEPLRIVHVKRPAQV